MNPNDRAESRAIHPKRRRAACGVAELTGVVELTDSNDAFDSIGVRDDASGGVARSRIGA